MRFEKWTKVRSTPTEKKAYGPIESETRILTREGEVVASKGDYILKEEDGNVYPISPEKFVEYYEVVEE